MAPSTAREKKFVDGALRFAATLSEQLPQALSEGGLTALHDELETQLKKFPSKLGTAAAARVQDFDTHGTNLWNVSTRLRRENESLQTEDTPIILSMTRVFAFLLLSYAQDHGKSLVSNVVRLIKIGLKAAKNCLRGKQYDLALTVLEKVVNYRDSLIASSSNDRKEIDDECLNSITAEYFIVRTTLAWRQDDLSLADHMFEKTALCYPTMDVRTAEAQADTLYEIGDQFLSKKEYSMAAKWLERAHIAMNNIHDLDRLSVDASELRISIINGLVKSLVALKESGASEQARSLVKVLEGELGDRPVVLLLKLNLLSSASDSFDGEAYFDTMHRMIRSLPLNETNILMILQRIRELKENNPDLACRALDALLRLRILESDKEEWVERLLNIRIWISIDQKDAVGAIASLEEILSTIAEVQKVLSSQAAHAAQTLLWRRIDAAYSEGCYAETEKLCQLAMNKLFQNSGDVNLPKFGRKLLQCALAQRNFGKARETFELMSDATKDESLTRFLMFKIATRCGELEFAAECLECIGGSSEKDPTILYACVLDTQHIGIKSLSLTALLILLENNHYDAPPEVHFPMLLRITINLTEALNNSGELNEIKYDEEITERLCKLFEAATTALGKKRSREQNAESVWTVDELDWFSKNSYNIATKHISNWNPRHSVRLLWCCIKFINAYPVEIFSLDIILRQMFCDFLAATALVSLARGEAVIEEQLQRYTEARKHVDRFDRYLQENLDQLGNDPARDLTEKLETLLSFDFEAACHLKAWDSLDGVLTKAEICKSMRVYEVMADCILSARAPTPVMIATLKTIVNQTWEIEQIEIPKMAIYMRCLFQSTGLDDKPSSEELLDQIRNFVAEAAASERPYPAEELEWIATRAFNGAVDLYIEEDEKSCRRWAGKAISIAHYHHDGGALERLLQSKFMQLSFRDTT